MTKTRMFLQQDPRACHGTDHPSKSALSHAGKKIVFDDARSPLQRLLHHESEGERSAL